MTRRCLTYRPGNFHAAAESLTNSLPHAAIDVFALDPTLSPTLAGTGLRYRGPKRPDGWPERAELHQQARPNDSRPIGLEIAWPCGRTRNRANRADDLGLVRSRASTNNSRYRKRLNSGCADTCPIRRQPCTGSGSVGGSGANPGRARGACPGAFHHRVMWTRRQVLHRAASGRTHQPAGGSIGGRETGGSTRFKARAEATLLGSGAERPRPLPGAAATAVDPAWRRPHSLADPVGARLTACAVAARPKSGTCRADRSG